MSAELAMVVSALLPVLAAVLVLVLGRWPNLRDGSSVLISWITFGVVLQTLPAVRAGETVRVSFWELTPGLELAFELEPLGMVFALVASGLWTITSLYAVGYMRAHHEQNQTRFFTCFALAIAGALGVAYSANLGTVFVAYEFLTFSTFPLVTHHGDEKAKKAGRTYIGILVGTSVSFLLLAVLWTWSLTGTLEFTKGGILAGKVDTAMVPVLLALFAFGTGKAALMPFHRWLPAAMVAPTPVSALLHAVAVVKAGVFLVMKVVVYVFGIELLHETGASHWLLFVAAFTMLAASAVALTKDNLKARLAYSTISQLSYIVLGAAMANAWGVMGGSMHIAMHAFGKITLFFVAGAIYVTAHKTEISDMAGIGRKMPLTMLAFTLASFSIIGLPPFGGSWSKWFLALGSASAHQTWVGVCLMISSLLAVGYLMPVVVQAFFREPEEPAHGEHGHEGHGGHDEHHHHDHGEARWLCLGPILAATVGCVGLFVYGDALYDLLLPITGALSGRGH